MSWVITRGRNTANTKKITNLREKMKEKYIEIYRLPTSLSK